MNQIRQRNESHGFIDASKKTSNYHINAVNQTVNAASCNIKGTRCQQSQRLQILCPQINFDNTTLGNNAKNRPQNVNHANVNNMNGLNVQSKVASNADLKCRTDTATTTNHYDQGWTCRCIRGWDTMFGGWNQWEICPGTDGRRHCCRSNQRTLHIKDVARWKDWWQEVKDKENIRNGNIVNDTQEEGQQQLHNHRLKTNLKLTRSPFSPWSRWQNQKIPPPTWRGTAKTSTWQNWSWRTQQEVSSNQEPTTKGKKSWQPSGGANWQNQLFQNSGWKAT